MVAEIISKIALFFLIIGVMGAGVVYYKSRPSKTVDALHEKWGTTEKIPIIGKTFINERVLLDGHSYTNCTFQNVRLIYNGTAPFDLVNITFKGAVIASDKPKIQGLLLIFKELKFFREGIEF